MMGSLISYKTSPGSSDCSPGWSLSRGSRCGCGCTCPPLGTWPFVSFSLGGGSFAWAIACPGPIAVIGRWYRLPPSRIGSSGLFHSTICCLHSRLRTNFWSASFLVWTFQDWSGCGYWSSCSSLSSWRRFLLLHADMFTFVHLRVAGWGSGDWLLVERLLAPERGATWGYLLACVFGVHVVIFLF